MKKNTQKDIREVYDDSSFLMLDFGHNTCWFNLIIYTNKSLKVKMGFCSKFGLYALIQ